MNANQVVRSFSVLAIVLAGFIIGTPSAAASADCAETLHQKLETVLPNGWSEAQACGTLQAMGITIQSNIVPITGNATSVSCLETLRQELGTVLPGGPANAQACSTLQSVEAGQSPVVIPLTGGQTTSTDPVSCWRDAGASSCR